MNDRRGEPPGIDPVLLVIGAVAVWGLILVGLIVAAVVVDEPVEVLAEREIVVELSEFEIHPDIIEVGPGTDLTFRIENVGENQHDLHISDEIGTERIEPGGSDVLAAGVVEGSYAIWCSIKGHREQGMEGRVELTDIAPTPPGEAA